MLVWNFIISRQCKSVRLRVDRKLRLIFFNIIKIILSAELIYSILKLYYMRIRTAIDILLLMWYKISWVNIGIGLDELSIYLPFYLWPHHSQEAMIVVTSRCQPPSLPDVKLILSTHLHLLVSFLRSSLLDPLPSWLNAPLASIYAT